MDCAEPHGQPLAVSLAPGLEGRMVRRVPALPLPVSAASVESSRLATAAVSLVHHTTSLLPTCHLVLCCVRCFLGASRFLCCCTVT